MSGTLVSLQLPQVGNDSMTSDEIRVDGNKKKFGGHSLSVVKINNSEVEKKSTSEVSVTAVCGFDSEMNHVHCFSHSWWHYLQKQRRRETFSDN